MSRLWVRLTIIAAAFGCALPADSQDAASPSAYRGDRQKMAGIVMQIRRADVEDEKAALIVQYLQLSPYLSDPNLSPTAHYWRGFALWRRALNGFNDSSKKEDLHHDLTRAAREFAAAREQTNSFVEAEIGEVACEGTLVFLHHAEPEQLQTHLARDITLLKDLQEKSPNNPRFLWVLGASLWARPAAAGGNQAAAVDIYRRALRLITEQRHAVRSALDPSWGEAELLMSLSWSSFHQSPPDLDEADRYARQALLVAPNWHFVRDILLPQIAKARTELKK